MKGGDAMNYLRLDPVFGDGYQADDGFLVRAKESYEIDGKTWRPAS